MKGGGLKMHGITHLSASACNAYAASPALYVMERLMNVKTPMGCAAHRGSAAERGVEHGLLRPGAPVEDCQAVALAAYDKLTALSADPNRAKEREAIPGIVATALKELRQYGVPSACQRRIEVRLPDVPVPFLGFVDFDFEQHGLLVDLKTELRLTSAIKDAHARQVALYIHGTNLAARLAYTTPSKIGVYQLEDAPRHVAAMRQIALRMDRFLSITGDLQELAGLLVPNLDDFRFNNPAVRAASLAHFGM